MSKLSLCRRFCLAGLLALAGAAVCGFAAGRQKPGWCDEESGHAGVPQPAKVRWCVDDPCAAAAADGCPRPAARPPARLTPSSCSTARIWTSGRGANPQGIQDGTFNIAKTGEISTKRYFGDCQLHIEWPRFRPSPTAMT